MSVIRAARSAEGRYVQIRNGALQDNRLSLRARGLMAYLLSLPPSTRVNSTELAGEVPEGRDAIRTALEELERYGYLRRARERTSKGTFRRESVVCDDPALLGGDEPGPGNPAPEDPPETTPPGPENPAPDSQALKDKDEVLKEPPTEAGAPQEAADLTVGQKADQIMKWFTRKYPAAKVHAVRDAATALLREGHHSPKAICEALDRIGARGQSALVGRGSLQMELNGGFQREQGPRTYADPGTSLHDNGLEVLW